MVKKLPVQMSIGSFFVYFFADDCSWTVDNSLLPMAHVFCEELFVSCSAAGPLNADMRGCNMCRSGPRDGQSHRRGG